jgi:hypothetical protein
MIQPTALPARRTMSAPSVAKAATETDRARFEARSP